MGERGSRSEKLADVIPPNFVFSPDDPFYFGTATCEMLHYKSSSMLSDLSFENDHLDATMTGDNDQWAAVLAAVVDFIMHLIAFGVTFYLNVHLNSMDAIVMTGTGLAWTASTLSTLSMFYGLFAEKPSCFLPKLLMQHLQITVLVLLAMLSVVTMSIGIEATNSAFGTVLRVSEIERDFGPIWPFNIAVLAFFSAALCIWSKVQTQGAYDYLLDKDFFSQPAHNNIALRIHHEE